MAATLKLNFDAGDNIEYAFAEAIRISRELRINVDFKFNDVNCFVNNSSCVKRGVDAYHTAIKSDSQHKYAVA